jgi:hypothetical protein
MNTQTLNELCARLSKVQITNAHINPQNRDVDGDVVMGESTAECGICYEEKQCNTLPCCNHKMCPDCLKRLGEGSSPSCPFCRGEIGTFLRENGFVDRDEDIEMGTPVTHHRNPYRTRNRNRYRTRNQTRNRTEDEDLQYAIALSLDEQEYVPPSHRRDTQRRTHNDDPRKSTCGYCGTQIIDVRRHQQRNQRCIAIQQRYHHS